MSTSLEERARSLFARYAYPGWLETHSLLVGRVAALLAGARAEAGDRLDVAEVALAGYLHDLGRSPLLREDGRDHADLSALALAAEGLGHLAEPARRHPVYRVLQVALAPRTLEEKIVYVADRRAGQRLESVESRLRDAAARHPQYAEEIGRSLAGALALEREVFAGVPFGPDDLAARLA
ncbi:MAG TPA: HD domain-containing protein [Candidatus Limnocylindrales bacterium]|nr:HD domain-containing protein [Candidatus Limnocylindrales bacterium]